MPFHTRDGTTVLFPTVSNKVLANITPLALLSKILAINPNLRHKNVAVHDIDSILKGMLARASVTSYDIKAECKGILERWGSSPDWAAVRQILRRADVERPGRDSQPSVPLEPRYPRTETVLPVQHLSERTREKLAFMGKTLRVYLPSRITSAALTKTTHIHLLGHKKIGGSKLYKVEIMTAFHPSLAIECESRSVMNRFLAELPTLAFSFDGGRVANVAVEEFDAKAHGTIYTLGSGPINENVAIHESLKRFFINEGYIENSDVVVNEENGVMKTCFKTRGIRGPAFMQKMSEVLGRVQDWLVPATLADTCSICQPGKKRAQVEAQSRQELDFSPIGRPKVRLPGQKATPVGFKEQPDAMPQLKRKWDVDFDNGSGLKALDDGREDVGKKLKVASEALPSQECVKLARDFLSELEDSLNC